MEPQRTLTERAAGSPWVEAEPGLAEAVARWEHDSGAERLRVQDRVGAAVQPAPIAPSRVGRHAVAAGVSRTVRTITRLPGAVSHVAAGGDPRELALPAAIEGFVDQLALGGAASAEVARIIEGSGSLFPEVLRDELAGRSITPADVTATTVRSIVRRSVGALADLETSPVRRGAVVQTHRANDATGRPVDVQVRRPGVAADLAADVRLMGGLATAGRRLAPDAGGMGMGPMGFVELIARIALEEVDLRFEALDLVELGLVAEAAEAACAAIAVARPVPGLASARVLGTARVAGTPLDEAGAAARVADPAGVIGAVTVLTLEAALVHGAFWADPSAANLVVGDDGTVTLVRAGVVGHLSPQLRSAGITFLKSLFSGDAAGQVEAMRIAGAVPDHLDTASLVAELSSADALGFAAIMGGGEAGLLGAVNEAVRLMLKHDLAPPVEVVLLLRTVFAVGLLSDVLVPEGGGFLMALMGLVPKLPDLLASLDADAAPEADAANDASED